MPAETRGVVDPELHPGSTLGEYRIERLLGRGGMGAVYEATHVNDGRVVALKLLSVDLDQLDARERFLREGRVAAAINHPNVVYIYGTEEINGTPIITMELVRGGTLEEKVKSDGPLPVQDAIETILQVIDGLDAALGVGVLHRDIKPSNCFVNADGTTKVGDFGLSKPVESIEQHKLTQTGLFLGTPVYSSPEQLLGESLDARSDIYAVGVTFYYLLTGRLPFESGSLMQVMAAVLNGTPAPMDSKRIPLEVQQVVLKALARHAKDRFQSYAEFRAAVAALRTPEFRPATLFERFSAWLVDTVPLSYLVSGIMVAVWMMRGEQIDPNQLQRELVYPFITLFSMVLAIGLPEAFRGAALGKWLVGIRVVDMQGRRIGFVKSVVRVTLLTFTSFIIVFAYRVTADEFTGNIIAGIGYAIGVLLPFVTARPSNGWRMLHDVVTGTRVVRPLSRDRRRRGDVDTERQPALDGTEKSVGKYVIVGDVPRHPGVVAGWDSAIQRRVWMTATSFSDTNGNEVPQWRREIARMTRLRWTGAIRTPDTQWEVFEAPSGEPLEKRLERPVSWAVQRNWITDLLREAQAASADGSWPAGATLDELWVTATDEIVLSDASSGGVQPSEALSPIEMMRAFAKMLRERVDGAPRPPHATRLLATIETANTLDEIEKPLHDAFDRPIEVSRRRRVGPMLIIGSIVILLGLVSNLLVGMQRTMDEPGYLTNQLIQFHQSVTACSFEYNEADRTRRCAPSPRPADASTNMIRDFSTALGRAWSGLGLPSLEKTSQGTPKTPEEVAAEKRLVEVYITSNLAPRIQDTANPSNVLGGARQDTARAIIARTVPVDSAEIARANYLVDTLWAGRTVHDMRESRVLVPTVTMVMIGGFIAILTVFSALLMRRGVLFRAFQLDLVLADGRLAPRWRTTLRALIIWSVALVFFVVVIAERTIPLGPRPFVLAAIFIFGFGLWIYGMYTSIKTPARGLADRIAGTYVVIS